MIVATQGAVVEVNAVGNHGLVVAEQSAVLSVPGGGALETRIEEGGLLEGGVVELSELLAHVQRDEACKKKGERVRVRACGSNVVEHNEMKGTNTQ